MPIGAKQDLIRPFGAPSPKGKARKMPFFLSFLRSRTPPFSIFNFRFYIKKAPLAAVLFSYFRLSRTTIAVAYTRKLQPRRRPRSTAVCPFKSPIRASCNSKTAQNSDSCTDYYVHILTFSSVSLTLESKDLQATFSILGREVAPKKCERSEILGFLILRTDCFCDDLLNIPD